MVELNSSAPIFDYTITPKKEGEWVIVIKPKDVDGSPVLYLNVGDSGYGTLSEQDNNRQSISFYGQLAR